MNQSLLRFLPTHERVTITEMNKSALRLALLADATSVNVQVWCEGLTHAGAEVHVLSFGGVVPKAEKTYQLTFPHLPGKLHYFSELPRARQLIRFIQPDVVIGYYVTGYGTLAALAGHHPLVQVTAGSDLLIAPSNPIIKRLVRFNLSRADLVLALAPHMAQAVERLGVARERILVLPHGIPVDRFANKYQSVSTSSDFANIISTRSLQPDYNIDLLIKSVHYLKTIGVTSSLTLAGDGPQRAKLERLAQKLALERQVTFVGFVSNEQLPALLAKQSVYVSLVSSDGVSASLLEVMAAGLLPIVPDNPANRYWINPGENGLLLEELSPVAVAEAIRNAVYDTNLRQRARKYNAEIVRARGDLYRNSEIFMEHLVRLKRDYKKMKTAPSESCGVSE
jgi:glycosyltransferase involved in cell wall biosynthesis